MPKVGKKSKLIRQARRVASSDPLPTPSAAEPEAKKTPANASITKSKNEALTKNEEPNAPSGQLLSRGQRKRQAKREQYLKKEKMILSTLMLQKREEQKRRIDGLDAIRDALLDTTKDSEPSTENETKEQHKPLYVSNRAKKDLVGSEIQRMNLVMQHPAFQENPFGAIQEHLRNTLADEKKNREIASQEKAKNDKAKQEAKKQEKKERLRGVKKSRKKYKPRRCH